jgi:hypothetical protein
MITASPGISDTASSAVFAESADVTIIWKIIVGRNQTHSPKISQYIPFNDFLLLDHFIIWELWFDYFVMVLKENN